jgi:hypothetical protein
MSKSNIRQTTNVEREGADNYMEFNIDMNSYVVALGVNLGEHNFDITRDVFQL